MTLSTEIKRLVEASDNLAEAAHFYIYGSVPIPNAAGIAWRGFLSARTEFQRARAALQNTGEKA